MKHALIVSFLIYFLLLITSLYPQPPNIKFDHLTIDDGLSGNAIERWQSILKDRHGFLWICTRNGLNKYDGYKFIVYKSDPGDPNSINSNWINSIYEDRSGILWIGTQTGGLNRFNADTETFTHFQHDPLDSNSLCDNAVFSICEDHSGDLWIGTQSGLSRMIPSDRDPNSDGFKIINYFSNSADPTYPSNNIFYTMYEDMYDNMWFGREDGTVIKYNQAQNRFEDIIGIDKQYEYWTPIYKAEVAVHIICHNQADPEHILTIGSTSGVYKYDIINSRIIDYYKNLRNFFYGNIPQNIISYSFNPNGILWLGTKYNGLFVIEPKNRSVQQYVNDLLDPYSITDNQIYKIYRDNHNILWIGTNGGGINKYDPKKRKFNYYTIRIGTTSSVVSSILEDKMDSNILWLGTDQSELLKYNLDTGRISPFKINSDLKYSITSIFQDDTNSNVLWIGSLGIGFYSFDQKKEKFTDLKYPAAFDTVKNRRALLNISGFFFVTAIIGSENNRLWLSTLHGLHEYDPATGSYISYLHDPINLKSISSEYVNALRKSKFEQGQVLWVGNRYGGGLNRFDINRKEFEHFKYNEEDSNSINNNYINTIYEDMKGEIWIGTPQGLNLYNRTQNNFIRVMDKGKSLAVEVLGILEDEKRNLWLHTQGGLYRYDPVTQQARHYDKEDGLELGFFYRYAYHKGKSGKMYIGGNGLVAFNPDSIKENPYIPPVVLTDFQIYNKSIKPGIDSPLKKALHETMEIKLSYEQSVFSLEFAALDFSSPQNNRYAYKMEGVDPDWVYRDAKRRYVTYTNLDPGEYLFQVKGSNNDGIWNEQPTSVKIIIMPPWWKSKVAYVFYGLFIIVLITVIWKVQVNRLQRQHQMELEHLEAEKLKEVDRIKSRFFTNISHEFRTPLTLIEGPISQLLHMDVTEGLKDQYQLILRNTKQLMNLVNQLLDLSKLESGRMKLQVRKQNIIPVLRGLVHSFESMSKHRSITFTFTSPLETIEA